GAAAAEYARGDSGARGVLFEGARLEGEDLRVVAALALGSGEADDEGLHPAAAEGAHQADDANGCICHAPPGVTRASAAGLGRTSEAADEVDGEGAIGLDPVDARLIGSGAISSSAWSRTAGCTSR